MSLKKLREFFEHLNIVSLSVPVGIVIVSVAFPLQPIVRQALIGVVLIWFYVELMLGFPFWK